MVYYFKRRGESQITYRHFVDTGCASDLRSQSEEVHYKILVPLETGQLDENQATLYNVSFNCGN